MNYDLYAIRYGRQDNIYVAETMTFSSKNSDEKVRFEYFFWIAKSTEKTILIDCGFSHQEGHRRGRVTISPPLALLGELGIQPEEITDLLLTHLHYDHAGNIGLFPHATIHLHVDEWNWVKNIQNLTAQQTKYYDTGVIEVLLPLMERGRVALIEGEGTELFGLQVIHVGGHCPGQMMVEVPIEEGRVLITSDVSHLTSNYATRDPFPIFDDLPQTLAGLQRIGRIEATGTRIVTGHDPVVFTRYASAGSSGNIVALHKELTYD